MHIIPRKTGHESLREHALLRLTHLGATRGYPGHTHVGERALSRRQFCTMAMGTAAVGAAIGMGAWRPPLAEALPPGPGTPLPISNGSPIIEGAFGQLFHLYVPGDIDPADAEPSSVFNFNGIVALAVIHGTGTGTEANGTTNDLFYAADMRFMQGLFVGMDGRTRFGTFSFL